MNYFMFGVEDLSGAVAEEAYLEGLSGRGDYISPSAGGNTARFRQQESRAWAQNLQDRGKASNQSGISRPQFSVGAGGSDKVKGSDGQWRQATDGDKAAMKSGTFDAKNTAQSKYQSQGGEVGSSAHMSKNARQDMETMQQAGAYGQQAMNSNWNVPKFGGGGTQAEQRPSEGGVGGSSIKRQGETMEQYGNRMRREAVQRGQALNGLGDMGELESDLTLPLIALAAYFLLRK